MSDIMIKKVLYVEDDPSLARLLQRNLLRRGFEVDLAPDGNEGLRMIASGAYDLALVDYNMPYCGGLDLLKALNEKGSALPVVMVTGEGNEEVAVEALKLGAFDYVVKDTQMRYLELIPAVIEKVLHRRQLLQERQLMQRQIEESEERYRKLVELSPDGIALHVDGRYDFVNPAGARLLGASHPRELQGREAIDTVHPDYRDVVRERLRRLQEMGQSVPWIEEKYIRIDGAVIDVEVSGSSFLHRGKPAVQVIFRDISERKKAEERLQQMALYDMLTGLPNRTLFFDRVSQFLEMAKRNDYTIALLFIDFDGFKAVNDRLGHDIGDLLLQEAAKRMKDCMRRSDTVARMGGDEFIGICGRITAPADAAVVARKIIAALTQPFELKGQACSIGASIGISVYPLDGTDADTLLKKADVAMYRVKDAHKGGYAFYSAVE